MELNFVARHIEITDRFRQYVLDKADKIASIADKPQELDITVTRHHGGKGLIGSDRVELTLIGAGPVVRAESDGQDKYAAFDLAMGRLMERLRRAKDRKKVHRGGAHRPLSLHEASAEGFAQVDITPATPEDIARVSTGNTGPIPVHEASEEENYSPVVIRSKVFTALPMSVDDALYHMELVGHDFYLYVDKESSRPSVVYRRKGWNYGVIELDKAS
jgi:ribosomal subunit interface protein